MDYYDFGYQTHNHVVCHCNYHIIWCTKYRQPVLDTDEIRNRLVEIAYEVSKELECEISEIEVMPDHVHMLISVPPKVGIAVAVRRIKGRTSRLLRQKFSGCSTRDPCSNTMDSLILLFNSRWGTACSSQAVHQEPT